ncbi:universal stress protein [Actinoplanes solisilvae]|uniref:universal stress protein n=1 Tax=Actinoplanes solisilvae TaxID=2486853 RepID=UPI0013E29BA5|nr:universal stress protein [Actinoplanes solisilvae]
MTGTKIVVGYDGSQDARRALRWGFREAVRTGAEVDMVYVWRWPDYLPAASMIPGTPVWPDLNAEKELETMLAEAVARAQAEYPGVVAHTIIGHGSPASVLRDLSAGASLLVVGGRGHGLLGDFWLGSVPGALAAHALCSVVVVREPAGQAPGAPILLGLDDSAHADRAAEFAFEHAAAWGAPLRVVRAWMPPPDPWIGAPDIDREEISTAELVAVREQVAEWHRKYSTVDLQVEAIVGHPYRVIAEAATQARTVVLGARGEGGFSLLRLGSVSRYVLHHVSATVAVVR